MRPLLKGKLVLTSSLRFIMLSQILVGNIVNQWQIGAEISMAEIVKIALGRPFMLKLALSTYWCVPNIYIYISELTKNINLGNFNVISRTSKQFMWHGKRSLWPKFGGHFLIWFCSDNFEYLYHICRPQEYLSRDWAALDRDTAHS